MADQEPAAPGLPAEISDSLASVWKRYAGRRPTDVETIVHGARVACVLRDAVHQFDEGLAAEVRDHDGEAKALTIAGYERDAINAVAQATRQRVVAFVSDHDSRTDRAKEVFILDGPPKRRRSIFLDHRHA